MISMIISAKRFPPIRPSAIIVRLTSFSFSKVSISVRFAMSLPLHCFGRKDQPPEERSCKAPIAAFKPQNLDLCLALTIGVVEHFYARRGRQDGKDVQVDLDRGPAGRQGARANTVAAKRDTN